PDAPAPGRLGRRAGRGRAWRPGVATGAGRRRRRPPGAAAAHARGGSHRHGARRAERRPRRARRPSPGGRSAPGDGGIRRRQARGAHAGARVERRHRGVRPPAVLVGRCPRAGRVSRAQRRARRAGDGRRGRARGARVRDVGHRERRPPGADGDLPARALRDAGVAGPPRPARAAPAPRLSPGARDGHRSGHSRAPPRRPGTVPGEPSPDPAGPRRQRPVAGRVPDPRPHVSGRPGVRDAPGSGGEIPAVGVIGYLSLDEIVIGGASHAEVPGGAALYAALGARAAGARVLLAAARGSDFPEAVCEALEAMGVDLSAVVGVDHPARRARLVYGPDGRRESGHWRRTDWHAATRALTPPLPPLPPAVVVLTAMPPEALARQIAWAREHGARAVVDTS